jgi:mono/diheme cytochrome c family protein
MKFLFSIILFACAGVETILAQANPALADKGKVVYEQTCLACHQADGTGVPQLTPSLVNASFVQGDKTRLITIVLKGLKDVEIDGQIYDNPMPPFETALTDEDIANVLTYIRSNFSNKAAAIKKEEVALVRKNK